MERTKTKKPDWEIKLKEMDGNIFGRIELQADGFHVTFSNQTFKRRIVTAYYLDGVWKGEYANVDSEIGKKFGKPMIMKHDKRHLEFVRKFYSKKEYNEAKKFSKIIGYLNYWGSTRSLISHLKKTCTQIEVIEIK